MAQIKWQLIFLAFLFFEKKDIKAQSNPEQRIVNGLRANPKQFPYQVFFDAQQNFEWSPQCGGVIISNRTILTAAHCVENNKAAVKIYFGAVDKSNHKEVGQQRLVVKAENIVVHSDYDSFQYLNDIALIKLPVDLLFDEYIQPANLPDPEKLYENESAVASGWGVTSDLSEELSQELMYYNVPILSSEECKTIMQQHWPGDFFTPSWICIKPSGSTPCYGDSGGPLVIRNDDGTNTLVGLTSFGLKADCPVNLPEIYTRVTYFLDWIKTHK